MRGPVRLITTPSPATQRFSGEIHEHACVRCPMLQVNPAMLPRLDELEADLLERQARAKQKAGSAKPKAST